MRLYLDDDIVSGALVKQLSRAGHDVVRPADAQLLGEDDPVHLIYCVEDNRVCLTRNYDDFQNLHNLIMKAQGHHPGILVVRRDDDPRRNMTPSDIVRAIRNLEAAKIQLTDEYYALNHWQ